MKSGGITTSRYPIWGQCHQNNVEQQATFKRVSKWHYETSRDFISTWVNKQESSQKYHKVDSEDNKSKFNFHHVSQFVIHNSTFHRQKSAKLPHKWNAKEIVVGESFAWTAKLSQAVITHLTLHRICVDLTPSSRREGKFAKFSSPTNDNRFSFSLTCSHLGPPRWQTWCEDSMCWRLGATH